MSTPRDGSLLKAPVQLARVITACWKCHKPTAVVAIFAAQVLGWGRTRYLVALFKRLPLAQTADDCEALLPWRLTAQ